MKRKRIEAWVTVDEYGVVLCLSHEKLLKFEDGWRDVRMVEHEPAAEAVVRAATKLIRNGTTNFRFPNNLHKLITTIERLEKRRAKK